MSSQDPDDRPGLSSRSSVRAVEDLYDRWAGVYDWNPVLPLVRPARRRAVEQLGLTEGDTVVDMGTGTGANLGLLRDAVGAKGTVIGIDVSPRMLTRARRRVVTNGWRNVVLTRADIREPPVDSPVDGVLSTFVMVMYRDPGRLIDSWIDHLKPATMANLYAGPSDRWYAPGVNSLLSLYLRVFEESWVLDDDRPGPLGVIERRGNRSRDALADRSRSFETETLVFGLAHLDIGRLAG